MSAAYPNCSMCSEDLIPDDGELCGACARAVSDTAKEMIAAAEERGRRTGDEERDALEKALREIESPPWSVTTTDPETLCRWMQRRAADAVLALHRALAPRDSVPKHKDWCALFGNPEAGKSCDCDGDRK